MNHILRIERTALDGSLNIHHLHAVVPGHYTTIAVHEGIEKVGIVQADSARGAVARTPMLRRIDGSDATRIHVHDQTAISHDDLLDILRPTLTATDLDRDVEEHHDYDAFGSWPHDIELAGQRWSTWHRVEVNGVAVYGVRMATGKVVLVDADSPGRPFDGWTELLATSWESSDYSAVGMAGYGIDGLYVVRPGLLATVHFDDENLDISIERVSRRAKPLTLVRKRLDRVVHSDRHHAQLVLAAHDVHRDAVYPSDSLSSVLDAKGLHRLLRN